MKLFYFFDNTTNIDKLKDNFENNIPQSLIPHPISFSSSLCQKHHGGGYDGWLHKYETVNIGFDNTKEGAYFIFSDIDIRFYKDISIELSADWYFQSELPNSTTVNIGFMIIKNCENSRNFWKLAYDTIEKLKYQDSSDCYKIQHIKGSGAGQFVINDLLQDYDDLRWALLPLCFWSKSIGFDYLDKNLVLHHANGCYGVKKKIDQLDYICALVNRMKNE